MGLVGLPLRKLDSQELARCSRHRHCGRAAVYELDGSGVQPPLEPPRVFLCGPCLAEFMLRAAPSASPPTD
jgi:hypothetical protein